MNCHDASQLSSPLRVMAPLNQVSRTGRWRAHHSEERLNGRQSSVSWQIQDGKASSDAQTIVGSECCTISLSRTN